MAEQAKAEVKPHQALYRKWRPKVFEDVIGQTHITKTLKNQITNNRIGHAYLFCGTRGTGKTTCAKIFSRAINCENNKNGSPCNECRICKGILDGSITDITELDAASNNGVDNIRDIINDASYVSTVAKYTVYIIDEVHMLSSSAFNALLKTLEEPPENVVFILATTEAHKIPQTIMSRCQRFDFRRIKADDIITRLREIACAEKFELTDEAYKMIARIAEGSMRDALSTLERIVSSCGNNISGKDIIDTLGISDEEHVFSMVDAIADGRCDTVISIIADVYSSGCDLNTFTDSVIGHFRDIMLTVISPAAADALDYSADDTVRLREQAKHITFEKASEVISVLSEAKSEAKWIPSPRTIYEVAFIRLARSAVHSAPPVPGTVTNDVASPSSVPVREDPVRTDNLEARVSELESKIEQRPSPDNSAVLKKIEELESKMKSGSIAAITAPVEKVKKTPAAKPNIRLYNPIPTAELTADNPIIKAARDWENISVRMINKAPYLTPALKNRSIEPDREGIILIFERDESFAKDLVTERKSEIESLFKEKSNTGLRIKTAFADEMPSERVDYWSLPHAADTPAEAPAEPAEIHSEDENTVDDAHPLDPLEVISRDFSEIVEMSDDTDFVNYDKEADNFAQTSLGDEPADDPADDSSDEEFLDEDEIESESGNEENI